MDVRDARPEEFGRIGDLRVAAYQADGFLSETSAYTPMLRSLGSDGRGEILAAVDTGELIGTVMLQFWPDAGEVVRGPGEAEIRALAVSPGARGRGIGHALLTAVVHRATERGVRELLLATQPDMVVAQRMYSGAGFVRMPDRDFRPGSGPLLMAFGRTLSPA